MSSDLTVQSVGQTIFTAAGLAMAQAADSPAQQALLAPLTSVGHVIQIVTPSTGTTVAANNATTLLLINNSGLIAAVTITLPTTPFDTQRFLIASKSIVTALTMGGGTINGALTTIAASGFAEFIYSAALTAWFRTG